MRSTTAATLWGFDLGLTLTAKFTFAGLSMLITLPMMLGGPAAGAALLASFWVGRVIPVWIAPMLLRDANDTLRLLDSIDRERLLFLGINMVAMTWLMMIVAIWIVAGDI